MSSPENLHTASDFKKLNEDYKKNAPQSLLKEFIDWMYARVEKNPWGTFFSVFVPAWYEPLIKLIAESGTGLSVRYEIFYGFPANTIEGQAYTGSQYKGCLPLMWLSVCWDDDVREKMPQKLADDEELHRQMFTSKFAKCVWLRKEDLVKYTSYEKK